MEWEAQGPQQKILNKFFKLASTKGGGGHGRSRRFYCVIEGNCDFKEGNSGGKTTFQLSSHIEHNHTDMPGYEELKRRIGAVQQSKKKVAVEKPTRHQVQAGCFMCGQTMTSDTLYPHRRKSGIGLPLYGCSKRDEFYQAGLWTGLRAAFVDGVWDQPKPVEVLRELKAEAMAKLFGAFPTEEDEEERNHCVYMKCKPGGAGLDALRYFGQGTTARRPQAYQSLARSAEKHTLDPSIFQPDALGAGYPTYMVAEELTARTARSLEYGMIQLMELTSALFLNDLYPMPCIRSGETFTTLLPEGGNERLRTLVVPLIFIALQLKETPAISLKSRRKRLSGQNMSAADQPSTSSDTVPADDRPPASTSASSSTATTPNIPISPLEISSLPPTPKFFAQIPPKSSAQQNRKNVFSFELPEKPASQPF